MIKIDFEKMGGLIPAVIQDAENGQVLMVAFMDEMCIRDSPDGGLSAALGRQFRRPSLPSEKMITE